MFDLFLLKCLITEVNAASSVGSCDVKNECHLGLSKIGNGQTKPSFILCV